MEAGEVIKCSGVEVQWKRVIRTERKKIKRRRERMKMPQN